MAQKKTRKLLKKILTTDNKRSMYTREELIYLEKMYDLMVIQHQRRKLTKKGFSD